MFLILDQSLTQISLRLRSIAERKGLKAVLLTSANIARDVRLLFHLSDQDISLQLCDRHLVIKTRDIEGVYCGINAFEPALWSHFGPRDAEYAARETQALWLSILASLPCRVVNPPALDSLAGTLLSTPEILYLAYRLGLYIPMVISLESGKLVADLFRDGVKARYADLGAEWISEINLSSSDIPGLEQKDNHFQVLEEVPGRQTYVTVLGDDLFACEVDARGSITLLPLRLIPRQIKSRLRTLHQRLNLGFAEYSFRVMKNGNWALFGCARPPNFTIIAYGDVLLEKVIDYALGKEV